MTKYKIKATVCWHQPRKTETKYTIVTWSWRRNATGTFNEKRPSSLNIVKTQMICYPKNILHYTKVFWMFWLMTLMNV